MERIFSDNTSLCKLTPRKFFVKIIHMITVITNVEGKESETVYNAPKHVVVEEFVAKHFCGELFKSQRPDVAREIARNILSHKYGQYNSETDFDGLTVKNAPNGYIAKVEIIV